MYEWIWCFEYYAYVKQYDVVLLTRNVSKLDGRVEDEKIWGQWLTIFSFDSFMEVHLHLVIQRKEETSSQIVVDAILVEY